MEQNKGLTFAIGLVALAIGVIVGLALCGLRGGTATSGGYVAGKDFRAGRRYVDHYYYSGNLRASSYGSFSRREDVRYESYESPRTIQFYSTDCTNVSTINRYEQELDTRSWEDLRISAKAPGIR